MVWAASTDIDAEGVDEGRSRPERRRVSSLMGPVLLMRRPQRGSAA